MSWTQPVCTHCWVFDNTVEDPEGGALIRPPARVYDKEAVEADPNQAWMDSIERCCKCGRMTASGIFIRIDPATVNYPSQED